MKASILALGSKFDQECNTCHHRHPRFTICGRCDRELGESECFICSFCDSEAIEFQERRQNVKLREARAMAYRDAGIPFEVVTELQDFKLPKAVAEWAQSVGTGWAGYAHDNLGSRRTDAARALMRRMRSRLPRGAAIVNVNELAMRGPIEIADFCKHVAEFELMVIDFPSPIESHAADKIFALLSSRHWSGRTPRATLLTRSLAVDADSGEVMAEILRMARTPNPRGDHSVSHIGAERIKGRFVQRCYSCGGEVMAAHGSTTEWVCAKCLPSFIESDSRFAVQAV